MGFYGGLVRVQRLPDGRLEYELAKVTVVRDPPVDVVTWLLLDGREWPGLLHGWAENPNGSDDGWRGLVTGVREYAPGFWTEFCVWAQAESVRPAPSGAT